MTDFQKGIIYSIITGLCWAVLAIALKYALHFCSPGSIVWARMIFAFLLLIFVFLFTNPKSVTKALYKPSKLTILAGVFLAINYFSFMMGVTLTTASNSQIMIQLGPMALLFIGVFYFRESLQWLQWLGVGLAFIGFIFYNWDQALWKMNNHLEFHTVGTIWLLLAAITWAVYAALQKHQVAKGKAPQEFNLLVYGVCTIALTPLVDWSEFGSQTYSQWGILLLLGLNTLIGYGAFAEALKLIPASQVSIIITINPLLTIALMQLFAELGLTFVSPEPIFWRGILGAILVVSGVTMAVALRKGPRKQRTPSAK